MEATVTASILINNFNYGHFLKDTIDSALRQSYPNVEVIVVDDLSTDDSREVIAGCGDRIIPALKRNGSGICRSASLATSWSAVSGAGAHPSSWPTFCGGRAREIERCGSLTRSKVCCLRWSRLAEQLSRTLEGREWSLVL